ncbi:GNAT family N-acetyltransferase [Novipirellula sp.]|uniref:GNAT family N-acetyltransferase n=1 Tax=Novipirellula sp. TaxID=2795430 RepID=UPI0035664FA6
MNPFPLHTQRLELVLPSVEEMLAKIDVMSPADKQQISEEWLSRVSRATSPDPWVHGFTLKRRDDDTVIGECAFKGPPDSDGIVEIAYHVFSDHQGNGFATETAAALTVFAFTYDTVRVVRAHTLPESNASTRVLTKCGFQYVGEVMDPDDGLVWRWEKHPNAV